jgi:D-glycero-D-manno-heptose 1,7-bisphosphate phosphatase
VILDRDGVINIDSGHPHKIEEMCLTSYSSFLIPLLRDLNAFVVVCTNQSGIGRGLFSEFQMEEFNRLLMNKLKSAFDFQIHSLIACPHTPNDDCLCRKPKPGMLYAISENYRTPFHNMLFIGDSDSDFLAAKSAGTSFEFVQSPNLSQAIMNWYLCDPD